MEGFDRPVFTPGWDALQAMNEQIVNYISVNALLTCVFDQNLLIMQRLDMGDFEELRSEWLKNVEAVQAEIITDILKKYPAKE